MEISYEAGQPINCSFEIFTNYSSVISCLDNMS